MSITFTNVLKISVRLLTKKNIKNVFLVRPQFKRIYVLEILNIFFVLLFKPRGRFLHSAITTDEYMFVFGGRTDPPSTNDTLIAYSYACNQWIRLLTPGILKEQI
jgi:hypothetical protein